ncbi:nucleolar protein of 40 kDa [Nematolebias whitei]|uniref:nucleolar protein of 40 kDa n=1 Tax=Nematolebias whitei TaxID=451745 RepID=UPI0018978A55|nr:nucleolar protein of 40 kDa [Nematolebias whitei]
MSGREGSSREPAGLDGLPPLYSIAKGEVVSVQTYGAFVRLPGYRKEGLVHVSEMSATRVESASEIVDVGEQVWIKVIGRDIQGDKVKLSFSMKAVNQGTGRDLDPNNVQAEQDARRRRNFRDQGSNRITLEAVLNTTCSKCGCKGHFTKDCYSAPGSQYALVPEEDDEEPQQQQETSRAAQQQDADKKKKKKEKKMKKKKKRRERKESESDGSSGECKPKRRRKSSSAERQDKKKKKKHKKEKLHKRS